MQVRKSNSLLSSSVVSSTVSFPEKSLYLSSHFDFFPVQGVDETMGVTLVYSQKRVATLSSSIRCHLPNEAFIIGTKGFIKVGKEFKFWR